MESNNKENTNWTICRECLGLGKVERQPSKKRRLLYQEQLIAFEMKKYGTPPQPPQSSMDICLKCKGTGLKSSETVTPVNSNYPTVAIIGGGIGGTALAVACLHRGIPFTLYERDASFDVRSQGYGLTLQQASKAIEGLGIFTLDGAMHSTRHVVHNPDGKIIGEWGLRKWRTTFVQKTGRKNVHIARQSLRLALLDQLHNSESVKWNHKLVGFSKNEQGSINLEFNVGEKTEQAIADLVVGADGIRSSVRELIISEHTTPLRYLGCIVILGICRLDSLNSESPLLDGATVFQTVNGHERIYAMPYDNNSIMWQLSFPMSEADAKNLCAKGMKVVKEESLRRLGSWHDPISQMLLATSQSDITGYPVYDRSLFDPDLLTEEGVTLIGDAAHPMSPFKGQGANQALLDALSLARKISTMCGPDSNWQKQGLRKTVLSDFEQEMSDRSRSKVEGSQKAVELLHSDAVLHEGDKPRGRGLHVDL